ncbi:cysteine-rich venom protein-like [Dermacentor variabilis]|uniref:cysteine-rich venom protein-like n=1 Tax=Dermacentor variabilis TaxID=34621 RepID=UPI003F5C8EED
MERATPALLWLWFSPLVVVLGTMNCKPPYNATHVMCAKPYQKCTTYFSEKALSNVTILWIHNHYRSYIALGQLANFPSAADMLQLRWDDDLAEVAEARGRRCVRSEGISTTDYYEQRWTADFPLVGQNLLAQRSNNAAPLITWERVVRGWFHGFPDYPIERVGSYQGAISTNAFSQLVWARTYAVGCSYTRSEVPALAPKSKVVIYVCNYGPAGGEIGKPLYQAGAPCSRCPDDTVCDPSVGLCVLQGDKPGADKPAVDNPLVETVLPPIVMVPPPEARDSAPAAVAVAVAPALAAALAAVHRWRHGAA